MKKEIKIDYTDWYEKVTKEEHIIVDKSDILDDVREGKRTSDVAIATIVNQEEKNCELIIAPNKTLLLMGAMTEVTRIIHQEHVKVKAKDGKSYNASAFIGAVKNEPTVQGEQASESYVASDTQTALERAIYYLETAVPGHIFNKLLTVLQNNGDVKNEAEKLKSAIDEIVSRLV